MTTYMLDDEESEGRTPQVPSQSHASPTSEPSHSQIFNGEPQYHIQNIPSTQRLISTQDWSPMTPHTTREDANHTWQDHYLLYQMPADYSTSDMCPRGWTPDYSPWINPEHDLHLQIRLAHQPEDDFGPQQPNTLASGSLPPVEPFLIADTDDEGMDPMTPQTPDDVDPTDGVGEDPPYSQLIYKALMSSPDHTMTVQEIYEWFRNNSTKCNNKGWQNSIRHNLSMNGAFQKPEKPTPHHCTPDNPPTSGNGKKSPLWVLEPWAVRDGVQATTRYRDEPKRRRKTTARNRNNQSIHPHPDHPNQTIPARARSGRRGGVAASRSRNTLRNRAGEASTYPTPPPPQHAFDGFGAGGQFEYQYMAQPPYQDQGYMGHGIPEAALMSAHHHSYQPAFDVGHYTLGDVQGVRPGNDLFEGGDMVEDGMVLGWSQGGAYGGSAM